MRRSNSESLFEDFEISETEEIEESDDSEDENNEDLLYWMKDRIAIGHFRHREL